MRWKRNEGMTLWKKSFVKFLKSHILEFQKYLVTAVQAQCANISFVNKNSP